MIKDIAKIGVATALVVAAPFAQAQTTTGTTDAAGTGTMSATTSGTTTPGVPNTGAGGDAATNALMLVLSGVVALGGIGYLATRRGVNA